MRDARVVLFLVAVFIIVGGCGGGGGDSGTPAVVKATVSGTVLDSRSNPVPAATVTINSTPVTTSTNSSGYFSAQVETGDHEIIVEKAGYSMFNTGFSVPSGSPVDLGSLIAAAFYPAYLDSDGDMYGDPDSAMIFTTDNLPSSSYTTDGSDCDDTLASINPGASEVCNGVDDDCDSQVDELFATLGDTCSAGIGECSDTGNVVCTADGTGVECNAVAGTSVPEICDGLDNNCDGSVDEVFVTLGNVCSVGVGECSNAGNIVCTADATGTECSVTAGIPVAELCDGRDNNCDGSVDEAFTTVGDACSVGVGECSNAGNIICTADATGTECSATAGTPVAEICDGLDNNCDGTADEGDPGGGVACSTGLLGVCSSGTETCQGGSLSCVQDVTASAEICDGLDNDCDGTPDDGLPIAGTFYFDGDIDGYGDPAVAAPLCGAIGGYVADNTDCGPSDSNTYPGAPEICDNIDNDCNALIDDSVAQVFYLDADYDGFGAAANVSSPGCDPPLGYVRADTDCDDTDSTINPLAKEICEDGIDQDCSAGDLACSNYSMQATTISPIVTGTWWGYSVSGDDTGMMYREVLTGIVQSPETGHGTGDVREEFNMDDINVWGSWFWDRFLFQDTNGTVRQAAMWWEDEASPNWVTSTTGDGGGGNFILYPSPMSVGLNGSTAFSYDTTGASASYAYTVQATEWINTPAGDIQAFRITTTYAESWPAVGTTPSEEYTENNTIWLHPEIGEVKRDWSFEEYSGGSSTPWDWGNLIWTLQDSSYFDTTVSCGGAGGGAGWVEKLEGTWYGGGIDDFIVTSYHDYYVTLTMDAAGNITLINLNSTDTTITGIVTAVDDSLYTIEFNDASKGQIIVDQTFNYMVFIGNFGFSVHGTTEHSDIFFSVLQKGAASLPTYTNTDVDGLWNGFGYAYCSDNSFYRFAPGSMNISGTNALDPRTVSGTGFSQAQWTGTLSLYSQVLGWWDGTRQDTAGMLFLRLSPDKQFAGAYLEVGFGPLGTGRYLVPEDYAFYAMHR